MSRTRIFSGRVAINENVRETCAILRRHGYQLLAARHGVEAFLICETQTRPNVRVLYVTRQLAPSLTKGAAGSCAPPKTYAPDALCFKVRELLDASDECRSTGAR